MKSSDKQNMDALLSLALLAAILTLPSREAPKAQPLTGPLAKGLEGLLATFQKEILPTIKTESKVAEEKPTATKAEQTINNMIEEIVLGKKAKAQIDGRVINGGESAEEKRIEALLAERGLKAGSQTLPSFELISGTGSQIVGILTTSTEGYTAMLDSPLMKCMPSGDYELALKRIIPAHVPV